MNILKKFSIYDLIVVAVMAAVGIAIKPVVVPLVHLISTPLMIPGGSLAGGLYMMWLVLAFAITGKHGSATLVGIVQAVIILFTPYSQGLASIFTYSLPGIAVDILMLVLLVLCRRGFDRLAAFLGGMFANLAGTFAVNVIMFHLPLLPLALSLLVAAFSGGIGGLIVWELYKLISKYRLIRK